MHSRATAILAGRHARAHVITNTRKLILWNHCVILRTAENEHCGREEECKIAIHSRCTAQFTWHIRNAYQFLAQSLMKLYWVRRKFVHINTIMLYIVHVSREIWGDCGVRSRIIVSQWNLCGSVDGIGRHARYICSAWPGCLKQFLLQYVLSCL